MESNNRGGGTPLCKYVYCKKTTQATTGTDNGRYNFLKNANRVSLSLLRHFYWNLIESDHFYTDQLQCNTHTHYQNDPVR